MNKADFPYLADWFAISMRWFCLLGATTALAAAARLSWPLFAILAAMALWNVAMSVLAMLNRRMQYHRTVNIIIDAAATVLLFMLGGGWNGALAWISLMSVLSAAIYYEWRGSILIALLMTAIEGAWTYFQSAGVGAAWQPVLLLGGYHLILGGASGCGSVKLMRAFRKRYFTQVSQRNGMERKAQALERTRLKAFYQLIETLSSTLNYNLVLDSILDLSQIALTGQNSPAETMPSAVLLFAEDKLTVANARRFSPSDVKRTFAGRAGILADTLESGEKHASEQIRLDAELGNLSAFQACFAAVCLPLARGLDLYGVMVFANPDPFFFTAERIELLEMVSHQAVIAIQNARLYQQLQLDNAHILETQEEARKKLARDLHDGPTQSVSAIAMRLEVARKLLHTSPREVEPELQRIEDLARRTTQEIRHMLFTMRPLVLESEGLTAALRAIADKTMATYRQRVRVETDERVIGRMDVSKQTVIFYLVEEAVNNARKHARAKLILVRLAAHAGDSDIALLEIIDNGVGFETTEIQEDYARRGSLGMINLKERTELVNGFLHIESEPAHGTRIQVYIPHTQAAADRIQQGLIQIQ